MISSFKNENFLSVPPKSCVLLYPYLPINGHLSTTATYLCHKVNLTSHSVFILCIWNRGSIRRVTTFRAFSLSLTGKLTQSLFDSFDTDFLVLSLLITWQVSALCLSEQHNFKPLKQHFRWIGKEKTTEEGWYQQVWTSC